MSFFYCNEVVCALELTCSSRPIWALELACALPFSQYIPGSRIPRSKSTHIFILNLLFFFEPQATLVEALSPDHWMAREFPILKILAKCLRHLESTDSIWELLSQPPPWHWPCM